MPQTEPQTPAGELETRTAAEPGAAAEPSAEAGAGERAALRQTALAHRFRHHLASYRAYNEFAFPAGAGIVGVRFQCLSEGEGEEVDEAMGVLAV
ncbi:MAG TPA: hypothetical protein VKU44_11790 [Terriglobia bacterium]|nr:hypothetical protein [Terriglobia bacterium]